MKIVIYILVLMCSIFSLIGKNGWNIQNPGTENFLYGVCFVDSLYGWVVGDDGLILHTNDGGKSWIEQEANVGSWLSSVHFINRTTGWAVGDFGRVRHTTNGGEKWYIQQSIAFPNELNSVYFLNEKMGWAIGTDGIIHSSDGGESWEKQASDTIIATKSIFFISEQVGWACGANGTIIKTADGGKNWIRQNSGNTGIIYDVFFLDLSNGWAVCRHEPKLLRTTNGGLNWLPQLHPVGGFFKNIRFIDKSIGWAVGLGGIIKSVDGGRNWLVQIPDSRYNLWWASFTDSNNCWAVGGSGTVLHTDNGGTKFIIDFKANILTGEAPLSTTFTDMTEGGHNKWNWDFGDGGTHTTQNPVYIYQNPGIYNVTLTVSDEIDSDSKTKFNYINVNGPDELIADFTADTNDGLPPLTVTFTDLTTGKPDSWKWDFGDGGAHIAQNPIHVYQNSGTYTVKLTAGRNSEQSSAIKAEFITVNEPIVVRDNSDYKILRLKEPSPNPISDYTFINFELNESSKVSLEIIDELGNIIYKEYLGLIENGTHGFLWKPKNDRESSLTGGFYILKLTALTTKGYVSDFKKFVYIK